MCIDMYRKLEGGMLTEKVEEIANKYFPNEQIWGRAKCTAALREMAAWVYQDAAKRIREADEPDLPIAAYLLPRRQFARKVCNEVAAFVERLSEEANKP